MAWLWWRVMTFGQAQFAPVALEPQRTIVDLAFDPSVFFGTRPFIGIRYLGDDYSYPVYAIAIDRECRGEPDCAFNVTARMVRSPNFKTVGRPRGAGIAVVRHVQEAKATTPEEIAAALDTAGLEWVETDLQNCPGAAAILTDRSEVSEPSRPSNLRSPGEPPIYLPTPLHADTVSVAFNHDADGASVYSGPIADARPSGWAVRLAAALDPCWRPSRETPPWRR